MNLESFEKNELLSLSEVVNDSITPLEDRAQKDFQTPFEGMTEFGGFS